jgi:hypothetical protein
LCEMLRREFETPRSLREMEQWVRSVVLEMGRIALENWLQGMVERYPAPTICCRHCGEETRYVRRREGQGRTILGVVRYRRAYYLCPHCHQGTCPLDEELGLRPNGMSAELERLAGMVGVQMAFGKGSQVFAELTLISLSDQALDKAAQAYGEEIEQMEGEWQVEARAGEALLRWQREASPPLRLYGALDGTMVHTRGEEEHPWRELKIGSWFEARGRPPKRPDGDWRIEAYHVSHYTDICPAQEFGELTWASGVQRNAQLARELIFLGDGAEWIWNLVEEHFPQATQIVDWFHACQYLTSVAQVVSRDDEERHRWLEQVRSDLWEGRFDAVIAACQTQVNAKGEEDPAAKAVTYFANNRHRMDYPTYRAQGYQIGSGTVESAAKQIGTQRMKVPGARWNLPSARRVAKARAAFLSGQWNTIAQRRTHLTSRS